MNLNQACRILDLRDEQVARLVANKVLKTKKVDGRTVYSDESVLWTKFKDMQFARDVETAKAKPKPRSALYLWPSRGDEKSIKRELRKAREDAEMNYLQRFVKLPIKEFVDSRGRDVESKFEHPGLPELFEAVSEGSFSALFIVDKGKRTDRKFVESVFQRGFGIRVEYLGEA